MARARTADQLAPALDTVASMRSSAAILSARMRELRYSRSAARDSGLRFAAMALSGSQHKTKHSGRTRCAKMKLYAAGKWLGADPMSRIP